MTRGLLIVLDNYTNRSYININVLGPLVCKYTWLSAVYLLLYSDNLFNSLNPKSGKE
jgi:hypothetical protein